MRLTDKINDWLNDKLDKHYSLIWYLGVTIITLFAMILGVLLLRSTL